MKNRDALRFRWFLALPVSVLHTVFGVLSVVLFANLEQMLKGNFHFTYIQSLYGAIFILPLFYFLLAKLSKRKTADVFDIFTVCMVFTLLCARINCLFSGCCLGAEIPGTNGLRWPTRETEILFYLAVLTFMIIRTCKKKNRGDLFPLYMAIYGAFRFVVEFFRDPGAGPMNGLLHIGHIWSVLSVCIGLCVYFEIQRKNNIKNKKTGGNKKK